MIDDERNQLVLWLSIIAFLVIVLSVVLGCTAPVSNAQSGLNRFPVVAGADPAEDKRSTTSKPVPSPPDTYHFKTAALQLEALIAAEQDAGRDVNKLGWFGAGRVSWCNVGIQRKDGT